MRLLLLLIFSFLCLTISFGQDFIDKELFPPKSTIKGPDSLIKTLKDSPTIIHLNFGIGHCNFLVNEETGDTLFLNPMEHRMGGLFSGHCGAALIDSIQIDGKGAKEILILRKHEASEEDHGGTYDISTTKQIENYQIWNVDSNQLLFNCRSYFSYQCANFHAYGDPTHTKGTCTYSCDFKVDETGQITIKNLKQKNNIKGTYSKEPVEVFTCKPAVEEGVFQFIDGKYQKVE